MGEGQGSRRVCGGQRWGAPVPSAPRVGPCPLGTRSGSLLPAGAAGSLYLWSWGPDAQGLADADGAGQALGSAPSPRPPRPPLL